LIEWFQKISIPTTRLLEILLGREFQKSKIIYYKGKYEAKLECPGEWWRGF